MQIVDSHTHIGEDIDGLKQTPEELMEKMESAGIGMAIIFPFNERDDIDFHHASRRIREITVDYPRLIGFGRVNPTRREQAIEAVRLAASLGLKGIKLHPKSQGFDFENENIEAVLAEISRHRLPVIIHTGWPSGELRGLFGHVKRFKEIDFIMGHMFAWNYHCLEEALKLDLPNLYLETSLFSCQSDLQWVIDTLGAERVIFGSDAPYNHPKWELNKFDYLNLTGDQRHRILGGNILRLIDRG